MLFSTAFAEQSPPEITLLVPGGAGGGWDLTARAMKESLEAEGLASARIELSPGPGGAVGLAQLLTGHRGDDATLLVGGLVMLSAGASQHMTISLLDATPIARLTGDYPVVVVPKSSPYRTLDELMKAIKQDTAAFPWAGGSSGSVYERLAGDLYEAAGLSRSSLNYVPHSSGRDVSESLLSGRARVGLSETAEIDPYVSRGELRPLAVAAPVRVARLDAPTLKEAGYEVVAVNWRGVFAGPGLNKAGQSRLEVLMERMAATSTWKRAVERRRWTDWYLSGEPYRDFIEAEQSRWSVPPQATELRPTQQQAVPPPSAVRLSTIIPVLVVLGMALSALWFRSRAPRVIESAPAVAPSTPSQLPVPPVSLVLSQPTLPTDAMVEPPKPAEVANQEADEAGHEPLAPEPAALPPAAVPQDDISAAFDGWKLTLAERDIALMMLQGLRYKQIAGKRGTSERTVRQQAQVILKKASLDGRADLAAHFLSRTPRRSA